MYNEPLFRRFLEPHDTFSSPHWWAWGGDAPRSVAWRGGGVPREVTQGHHQPGHPDPARPPGHPDPARPPPDPARVLYWIILYYTVLYRIIRSYRTNRTNRSNRSILAIGRVGRGGRGRRVVGFVEGGVENVMVFGVRKSVRNDHFSERIGGLRAVYAGVTDLGLTWLYPIPPITLKLEPEASRTRPV